MLDRFCGPDPDAERRVTVAKGLRANRTSQIEAMSRIDLDGQLVSLPKLREQLTTWCAIRFGASSLWVLM